ncbi:hypothetical protein Nepgr_002638 [Nepenthes gracilis]|uniref:Uncharacterized protein n=1 Tax=Nepenthes gracilis TaxID=150966 RepID=A0AAD3RXY5_NEPGR|nr:hypothetical protein Nepgr_002638 [Nepenthes gracilis]
MVLVLWAVFDAQCYLCGVDRLCCLVAFQFCGEFLLAAIALWLWWDPPFWDACLGMLPMRRGTGFGVLARMKWLVPLFFFGATCWCALDCCCLILVADWLIDAYLACLEVDRQIYGTMPRWVLLIVQLLLFFRLLVLGRGGILR